MSVSQAGDPGSKDSKIIRGMKDAQNIQRLQQCLREAEFKLEPFLEKAQAEAVKPREKKRRSMTNITFNKHTYEDRTIQKLMDEL